MGRRARPRLRVETAYSPWRGWKPGYARGELDEASAKAEALALIKGLRYGNDDYWINDSHPTMVMHPMAKPELDGKDLSGWRTSRGSGCSSPSPIWRRPRAREVAYYWPKPG